jgi:hypothetical protein
LWWYDRLPLELRDKETKKIWEFLVLDIGGKAKICMKGKIKYTSESIWKV